MAANIATIIIIIIDHTVASSGFHHFANIFSYI